VPAVVKGELVNGFTMNAGGYCINILAILKLATGYIEAFGLSVICGDNHDAI
jgi:hypothetical protein